MKVRSYTCRISLVALVFAAVMLFSSNAFGGWHHNDYDHYGNSPVLSVSNEVLNWTKVGWEEHYEVLRNIPGQISNVFYVNGTTVKPLGIPCRTLGYKVKPSWGYWGEWSNEVHVTYGCEHEEKSNEKEEVEGKKHEEEINNKENQEKKKQEEQKVKEKEEQEHKEKEKHEKELKEEHKENPEETKKEEEPHGASISSTPSGPESAPGGWSIAYGDSFSTPIHGTPQANGAIGDNTWVPEEGNHGCCNNGNEPSAQRVSQVKIGSEGLEETCTYSSTGVPGNESRSGKTQHYFCGGLGGAICCSVGGGEYSGYKTPWIELGKDQTLAFQVVAKLPPNTDEADPAWWADGPPWNSTEVDFPEFYGASSEYKPGSDWENAPWYYVSFGEPHPTLTQRKHSFAPDKGFHTYTFEIIPGNKASWFKYRVYVDGQLQMMEGAECYSSSCAISESVETKATSPENLNLILDYSLRENGKSEFLSGSRTFDVRSAAVYEDKEHAGIGIGDGGLAPGTSIAP
jgi:hypothetical protein